MSNSGNSENNSLGGVVGDIINTVTNDVVHSGHGGTVEIDISVGGGKGGGTTIEITETIVSFRPLCHIDPQGEFRSVELPQNQSPAVSES